MNQTTVTTMFTTHVVHIHHTAKITGWETSAVINLVNLSLVGTSTLGTAIDYSTGRLIAELGQKLLNISCYFGKTHLLLLKD